jgi:hypothetical protein
MSATVVVQQNRATRLLPVPVMVKVAPGGSPFAVKVKLFAVLRSLAFMSKHSVLPAQVAVSKTVEEPFTPVTVGNILLQF